MTGDDVTRHELDGFAEAAIRLFRALETNRQKLAAEHGFSSMELRALFRVAAEGSLAPKELALDLGVTRGAITGISDRLIGDGLMRRTAHPNDRRSIYLELTAEGNAVMRGLHASFRTMVQAATDVLGPSELDATTKAVGAVADRITEILRGGS
jgi:MarR family 2-MHQ and catechol resistance regulon transcriptional repressor